MCTHGMSGFTGFLSVSTPRPRCTLGCVFTEDAFVIIIGVNLDGTSFAAEMCATIVPLFKVTVLLDRFFRVDPTHLDPALRKP